MPEQTRAERLDARFRIIQQTLKELYGEDEAFAAACAGWLIAIEQAVMISMIRILKEPDNPQLIKDLDAEHEIMLRGFHREICIKLGVDPSRALELSKHFEEVVHDILNQRG